MAGASQRLQWYKVSPVSEQTTGGFGRDSDLPALFWIKPSERDGGLRLHTGLPGNFRVGAFGHAVDSVEHGQAYAEEVLRDFYRTLKKQMEPPAARKKPAGKKEESKA